MANMILESVLYLISISKTNIFFLYTQFGCLVHSLTALLLAMIIIYPIYTDVALPAGSIAGTYQRGR
jgi:hypothetical protein